MAIEYLKKAAKTPETETGDAREVAAEMLADIEARGEAAVRDYAREARPLDRRRSSSRRDEIERRTRDIPAGGQGATSSSPPRRCAASPSRSANRSASSRSRSQPGPDRRPAARPGQRRRLLRADRPLRAHRLGLHDHRDRQGGRRADRRRLLDAVSGRGHPSAGALRDEGRRRRRHHDARRRAGDRRDGLRPVHRQAGRHHRRARQQVRRRGQAHAVRQGRHRRLRRARRRSR